jgi:hypothetical protein
MTIFVKDYYPTLFGKRIFYVQTGSMDIDNGIPVGALIIDDKPSVKDNVFPIADIERLDNKEVIISFSLSKWGIDTIVTHRIVSYYIDNNEYVYTTKGDANVKTDGIEIRNSDIVGIYSGSYVPVLGGILGFASSIYGLGAIVLSVLTVWLLYYIAGKKTRGKNEKRKA